MPFSPADVPDATAAAILRALDAWGWRVSVFRFGLMTELHAVGAGDDPEVRIVRCEGEDGHLLAGVIALAEACGVTELDS